MAPPRRKSWLRRLFGFFLFLSVLAGLASLFAYSYYRRLAEQEDISRVGDLPQRSIVFDRFGEEIGRLHGANRIVVSLDRVSSYFIDALIAREDSRFFKHGGIDYRGVARAVVRNLKDGEFVQGASTITMQLARVSYDIREKTLHRKLLESMLARRIEEEYSKEEILTLYINRVYFGTGIYGIERASQGHFGKAAADLTLAEAAMLAGIIRAPNRFSPFRHYEDAAGERDTVLGRMLELGFITEDESAAARAETIAVLDSEQSRVYQNSYPLDLVRRDLELILEKAETEDGGLLIYTTLDLGLQQTAEESVEAKLTEIESREGFAHPTRAEFAENHEKGQRTTYLQGAAIAIDNKSGGIRALVGGRDFNESQFNRATMSDRPIGSLFKPFVYASAFQTGLLPGSLIDDGPIYPGEIREAGNWSPGNSDGEHRGFQTAEYGLIKSRNTMTVRVGARAGLENVLHTARLAGIESPKEADQTAQVYIGNLGADLKTVTSAFTAFPRGGDRRRAYVIEIVQNRRGGVLYQNTPVSQRVLTPAGAWMAHRALEKVIEPGGTGQSARSLGLEGAAAGKTGTTDAYKDAWFVGYNDKLTCGVWVGLDQPKTIMDRGYGSTLALPIWTEIMVFAQEKNYPSSAFKSDVQMATVDLCSTTGLLANRACSRQGHGYRAQIPWEMLPQTTCEEHHGGIFRFGDPAAPRNPESPRNPDRPGIFGRVREIFRNED
jgi:penicillin-binding protein 1A